MVGVWRHAEARVRGMKRVQVEPHLSVTGACSAQWVPIKPEDRRRVPVRADPRAAARDSARAAGRRRSSRGTRRRRIWSGPHGYYLRDRATRKPLVWDAGGKRARAASTRPASREALEGRCERRRDRDRPRRRRARRRPSSTARPAFDRLVAHMARVLARVGRAASATCRRRRCARIAHEFIDHACVGETIEIDGRALPYRPVAVSLGKTVNNGWGGYECCWARTMLAALVGGARGAGRHARHDGAAEPADVGPAARACSPAPTASWRTR